MSWLEKLEIWSKIILTGVAAVVIGHAGNTIKWEQFGLEQDKFCFNYSSQAEASLLKTHEEVPKILAERYSLRCNITLKKAEVILDVEKLISDLDAQKGQEPEIILTETGELSGYVALGKVVSNANFNILETNNSVIDGDIAPNTGVMLKANKNVYLRENTAITTSGNNLILSLVEKGECVKTIEKSQKFRSQYWTKVVLTSCE